MTLPDEALLDLIAARRSDAAFMGRLRERMAQDKPILDALAGDLSRLYRLSWEMVDQRELWRYCNADPNFYKNTTQTVPNSQIPDEHWHPLSKMTDNPWQQFNTLREWAAQDREFVRNVRLEAMSITYTEAGKADAAT